MHHFILKDGQYEFNGQVDLVQHDFKKYCKALRFDAAASDIICLHHCYISQVGRYC